MDRLKFIVQNVNQGDRYLQLAEECSELSQALLKYVRCATGTNPTRETLPRILTMVVEELADVQLCIDTLTYDFELISPMLNEAIEDKYNEKLNRWINRIQKKGE